MLNFLKKQKRVFIEIIDLIKEDKKRKYPLPLKVKWRMWRKGFLPSSFVEYNLSINDSAKYISDFTRVIKCNVINGEYAILLDDKYLFAHFLRNEPYVSLPEFYIKKKNLILFETGTLVDFDYIFKSLNNNQYLFKPSKAGGGNGIFLMDTRPELWEIDSVPYSKDDLRKLFKELDDYLIFKKIIQSGFAHNVNPNSVNTIRMLTMIDPHNGKAFLGGAYFRFGTVNSGSVDNMSKGGIGFGIDLQTGKLGKGAAIPVSEKLNWVSKHPDTGFNLEGFTIPLWDYMKNEVLSLSQRLSFLPYIGWDIAPMENDFIIIEANSHNDFRGHQRHEPLLNSPKVKSFYEYYGVI